MDAPEAIHDPLATPLEIPHSTAPECDYEPQDFPPEIGPFQGLEAIDQEPSLVLTDRSQSGERTKQKLGWKWLVVLGFVIIAVGVGGGI